MSLKKEIKGLIGYLNNWLPTDSGNEVFNSAQSVDMLKKQWDDFSDIEEKNPLPDKDEMLLAVYRKIATNSSKDKKRIVKFRQLKRIAAVIVLPLIAAALSYLVYNQFFSVKYIEVSNPKGSRSEFFLPDGSRVWLNAMSNIKYPEEFNTDKRFIELSGEAFFDIKHNNKQPFVVKAANIEVRVLGTKFNISAYPDTKKTETILQEGEVAVAINKNDVLKLKPNQQISIQQSNGKYEIKEVDAKRLTSWKFGRIVFDNCSISEIVQKLQRLYDVDIEIKGNKQTKFSFTLRHERIDEVFELLSLTSTLEYSKKGKKYIVVCNE